MSNDKHIKDDQEYQFPDDEDFSGELTSDASEELFEESATDDSVEQSASDSKLEILLTKAKAVCLEFSDRFPLLKNKKVMVTVVFIAGSMVVLHFVRSSSEAVNTASMEQQTASQPAPTTVSKAVDQRIDVLSDKQNAAEHSVSQLTTKMNQLSSSVSSVQQSQRATNQSIRELAEEMKQVSVQLSQVEKVQESLVHPKTDRAVPAPKLVTYHIKAVESGRVWILGSNGESKSVVVGDTINKRYGQVVAINADQGLVYTTSKIVISFGPSDR